MFLQSLTERTLCFILLPARVIVPDYEIHLTPEEQAELQLPDDQPEIGADILCASLVCSTAGSAPTANLMAPIIVNLKEKIGMQVIVNGSEYGCRHQLCFDAVPVC